MGMTAAEKILAKHAGKKEVKAGDFVFANIDLVLGNDITSPVAFEQFKSLGAKEVFDKERIALVPDHFTPNKDLKSAANAKMVREFARQHQISNYFEVGRMGIEHVLLPEQGLVLPGELIVGSDSHTCTYGALGAFATGIGSTDAAVAMATGKAWFRVPETIKFIFKGDLQKWVSGKDLILAAIGKIGVDGALYQVMEFCGEVIEGLSMDSRFTMCNMAIEAGGKTAFIAPDDITLEYVSERAQRDYQIEISDKDAQYAETIEIDVSELEPLVACPPSPANVQPISKIDNIKIDQVVIGSCTNGRLEDLRIAAEILKGRKIHPNVRMLVFPGTQQIYREALKEGIIDIFVEAGAAFSTPTCGPCLGGHMGLLAEGERAVSTTNRNFVGRMGHPNSEVFLTNPALAAASGILGRIASPEEVE
ncbi:MAG: 3-isopropylmalate/(R)-2-methylmalate dehydratase large subunit [Clostridia bacterium]|jgi:3-isopropylmalate/(R)-2-methylmalate dehydratase large subunit|nr:leuC [Clostridiales bacterium]MDK2985904.1 3-isopropylmalate/(R)-2-methylmalate dehydratase large subunit [Clostridia bacterium]